MSFNRNSNKPRTFNTMHIDTSNWPEQHRFIANLPDQVTDFNEQHWLGLMFPSRDYQRHFDDFLAVRRKLNRLDLLADYNRNGANISEDQVRNRLQNSNEINPFAGASLAKAYHQMDIDFGGVTGVAERVPPLRGNPQLSKAFFNIMMCINAETIVKHGYTYSQADGNILGGLMAQFYPVFSGSNEEKEFKVYTLIKKFWIDSSLYIFMDVLGDYPDVTRVRWNGQPFVGNIMNNRLPRYNKERDGLTPPRLLPILILYTWLGNLPAENMRFYNLNMKKAFANGMINAIRALMGNFMNGLGGDGSIKLLMANYLVNQDYLYLFSAILSIFTHPQNGLPSFDQYWTNSANTPATLDPNDQDFTSVTDSCAIFPPTVLNMNNLRNNLGLSIDINHVDKVYKFLSKQKMYKKKKTSKLLTWIDKIKTDKTKSVSDMTPQEIQKFQNISATPGVGNIWSNIQDNGFYLKPPRFGPKKFANSFVWRQRGGRKTLKKTGKSNNKTRKL